MKDRFIRFIRRELKAIVEAELRVITRASVREELNGYSNQIERAVERVCSANNITTLTDYITIFTERQVKSEEFIDDVVARIKRKQLQ